MGARRTISGGILALAALALSAGPASASTATISSNTRVNVSGQGNERNQIVVGYEPGTDLYRITDAAGIDSTGLCTDVNATTVTCPGATVASITVGSGGGSDAVRLDASVPRTIEGTVDGGSGNDQLLGSTADDTVAGGRGNDLLNGGLGADELRGGSGTDIADYGQRATGVTVTVGARDDDDGNELDQSGNARDSVRGDVETVVGSAGLDMIIGDSSRETLIGGEGDDLLVGGRGNDGLLGFAGNDLLSGEGGSDTLRAAAGNDRLFGGDSSDRLAAGPGDDFLKGQAGTDAMKGKGGIDRIGARDGEFDVKISCGPGGNRREAAKRDKRIDPRPKSC